MWFDQAVIKPEGEVCALFWSQFSVCIDFERVNWILNGYLGLSNSSQRLENDVFVLEWNSWKEITQLLNGIWSSTIATRHFCRSKQALHICQARGEQKQELSAEMYKTYGVVPITHQGGLKRWTVEEGYPLRRRCPGLTIQQKLLGGCYMTGAEDNCCNKNKEQWFQRIRGGVGGSMFGNAVSGEVAYVSPETRQYVNC